MPIKCKADIKKRLQELLSFLSEDGGIAIDLLLKGATIMCFQPRQPVYHIGSVCDSFLILLAGTVQVQLSSSTGRQVTLCRIAPGEYCSLTTSCLFGHSDYPADAIAESRGEAVVITKEGFHNALQCSPGFRRYIFDGYSASLVKFIGKIEQLSFVPIDTRLSNTLLDFHKKGEDRVTHQELAVELGTAREVVSRRLKHFQSEGWIRLARGRITVSDRDGLQQLGEPGYLD